MRRGSGSGGRWVSVAFGVLLAGGGAAALASVATAEKVWWWGLGGCALAAGAVLIYSAMRGPNRSLQMPAPRLGEVVVRKGWVTEGQLAEALVRHHHSARALGRMLVEMKLITPSQLTQALQEQQSHTGGAGGGRAR